MIEATDNPSTHIDPLRVAWVPEFDARPESCPACGDTMEAWSLELARTDAGLCACSHCGVMVAA